jgi:hypothetical protein
LAVEQGGLLAFCLEVPPALGRVAYVRQKIIVKAQARCGLRGSVKQGEVIDLNKFISRG